jgi:methylase of polypeptide subunit release factors
MNERTLALVELGRALASGGYEFVTVTPATHARVVARRGGMDSPATNVRDVFGWSLPFAGDVLPATWLNWLEQAEALTFEGGRYRSRVRFSSLRGHLFVHSAAPTTAPDSVFFGPDTYRFASFLERYAPSAERLVDIGCGSGAGGLVLSPRVRSVVLGDVNRRALELANVNATLAGARVELVESDVLAGVSGAVDLAIANPPYLRDDLRRQYRDGGGAHGEGLALRIVRDALERLGPGGTLLLYTGAPVVAGRDYFLERARPLLAARGASFDYFELDPDVFGEELDSHPQVERFAAVGLVARVP